MIAVWFGILVLSFSWLRAHYVFTPPQPYFFWIAAGIVLLVVGLRKSELFTGRPSRPRAAFVVAASVLGAVWFDGPLRAGFLLLGATALLRWLPAPRALKNWVLPGVWMSGVVLVVQGAVFPLLYVFSSRYHATSEVPFVHDLLPGNPAVRWLEPLILAPLKLLKWGTSLNGSTIYFPTPFDTFALTPTWEKLGLFPLALFAAGAFAFVMIRPAWRRRLPALLLWLAVFAYGRFLVLFLVVSQLRLADVFWRFDLLLLSFLPLPAILAAWWYAGRKEALAPFAVPSRARSVALGAVLFAGGLAAFWGFHDPGARKAGRVLIDERHSNWEWTTQPFDTVWYGGKSGYNYYCLADYWNYFYHVETRSDSLTQEMLSQWDVLVIKTPTLPFAPDEVDAIVEFVRRGGGLFLIGDHTNVFGTSTFLNPIAERFGMYFRYDATYELANLALSLYKRPRRFAHPAVRFMPNYLFATSCTLFSPLLSENVILGYGLRGMYLDYSETSYFPVKEGKVDYDFGLFVQAGGVKYGKGRVLGYTDSTCFSNFFMFMPGKPELALGSIEWLNRSNRWSFLRWVFLLSALFGLALLYREGRRASGVSFWNTAVASGALAVTAVSFLADGFAARWYALPQPQRPPVYATFDQEHGNYLLPSERLGVNNWQNFQTFFVWTQRLGIVPRNEYSVEAAVKNSSAIVEIQPVVPFEIEELDLIMDFVQKGGTLIVLDSPENLGSTSSMLLGPFGLAFDGVVSDSIAVLNEKGDTLGVARKAYAVKEGVPLLTLADGRAAMAYRQFGQGKVVACGAAYVFSAEAMGSTAVVPTAKQRRLFQAEYDLFGRVAGLQVSGRYHVDEGQAAGAEAGRSVR